MNKKTKILLGLAAGSVMAANVVNANELSVQEILNKYTSPYPGVSSVTVGKDEVNPDAYWNISASGGSVATIVLELAGNADNNTFGIFDRISGLKIQVFDGLASQGDQALISIKADGTVKVNGTAKGVFKGIDFGYFLEAPSDTGNNTFYSATYKNDDNFDHMWAYRGEGDTFQITGYHEGTWGPNEYILAWEDTYGGGDKDHNDFVVMVESVNPVPTPDAGTTLMLLGMGMLGLGSIRRKLA